MAWKKLLINSTKIIFGIYGTLSVLFFTAYLILGIKSGILVSFIDNMYTIIFHCW